MEIIMRFENDNNNKNIDLKMPNCIHFLNNNFVR